MPKSLERAIAAVAPRYAHKRAAARLRLARMEAHGHAFGFGGASGYEGASRGRRTHNWLTRQQDANAALQGALRVLRERSRDLCRNNPWAVAGVDTIEEWVVGAGIQVQPKGSSRVAMRARQLWRQWAEDTWCDAEGSEDLAGLQALVMRTAVESGSCLLRRRIRTGGAADGRPVPIQLQVLEPDHLDLERTVGNDGNRVEHGVEFNRYGRRVAYWLYPEHPGSSHPTVNRGTSVRIPAREILHVLRKTRAGQVQAAPWLTPAILRMRSLDEFEDAELLRMVIASNWAGFITTDDDEGRGASDDERIEDIQPGALEYLKAGEDITFPDLPQVSGRDSYVATQLRAIASGLRVPYEALTGDLQKVNFSSGRMGFNAFERRCSMWRRRMLWNQFLRPVWGWFVELAMAEGQLGAGAMDLEVAWTPPERAILDPEKEGAADFAAIRNGAKSLHEVLRSRGKDPETHLQEVSESFQLLDELGLILDCDPRRVGAPGAGSTAGGKEAEPADEAAEEEEAEGNERPAEQGDEAEGEA